MNYYLLYYTQKEKCQLSLSRPAQDNGVAVEAWGNLRRKVLLVHFQACTKEDIIEGNKKKGRGK